jgi:streptogramin lyase
VEYPLVGARPLGDPVGIAVGRGSVWVLTRGADIFGYRGPGDEVLRLSPETGSVLARHDAPGQQASGAGTVYGLAVGAEAVWVTNAETGRLFAFHPSSLALRRGRDVGRGAAGVPSVGYGYVWASAASGSSLVRIDPRTFRASRLALGGRVVDVTFAAGSVWANDATAGAVYRIDPRTASIVAEITLTAASSRAPALGSLASPTIAAGAGGVWVTVGAPAVR